MLKKILAFICGVVPVGTAVAADSVPVAVQDIVSLDGFVSSNSANIVMGGGVVVDSDTNVAVQSDGISALVIQDVTGGVALNVADAMNVFSSVPGALPGGGTFIIGNNVASSGFTLMTGGDVTVGGKLTVNGDIGRLFNIEGNTTSAVFDMSIGSITNSASFNVKDVSQFTVGQIINTGNVEINAVTGITTGAITIDAGRVDLTVTGDNGVLNVAGVTNQSVSGNVGLGMSADSISVGYVSNSTNGVMDITAQGAVTVAGNVENSGTGMTIDAAGADVVIGGTMKNDAGKLVVEAGNLTVNGGDGDNASFVNSADVVINVSGETKFVNGLKLDMEQSNWGNSFSLETGSLVIGGDTATVFANNLNYYNVVVGSAFETGDVSNGLINGLVNSNANMSLTANGLTVEDVTNYAGVMTLATSGTSDLFAVSLLDKVGATTHVTAGGNVNVSGNVVAGGNMTLQGQQVLAGGLIGNGGTLNVVSTDAANGLVKINGDIINQGQGAININGRQIDIVGNINNLSGTLDIDGSDLDGGALHIGGLNVGGGAVYVDADEGVGISQVSGGSIMGTGTLSVDDGVLNFDVGTHSLTIGGDESGSGYDVDIAGNIVLTKNMATSGEGDVYITAYGPTGFFLSVNDDAHIGGSVLATDSGIGAVARTLNLSAGSVTIDGDVTATGDLNKIALSTHGGLYNAQLSVGGNVSVSEGGQVEFNGYNVSVNKLTEAGGAVSVSGRGNDALQMNVVGDGVSIANGITFDDDSTVKTGLIISDLDKFALISEASNQDVVVAGGVDVMDSAKLVLQSGRDVEISGAVSLGGDLDVTAAQGDAIFNGAVTVAGGLDVNAEEIVFTDITNNSVVDLESDSDITFRILSNTALSDGDAPVFNITANTFNGTVKALTIESNAGTVDIATSYLDVTNGLMVTGGMVALEADDGATFGGDVVVSGVLNQGANKTGMLNLLSADMSFSAKSMTLGGLVADSNSVLYNTVAGVTVNGGITIDSGATVTIDAKTFSNTGDNYVLRNNGIFDVTSTDSVSFDNVINTGLFDIYAMGGITMAEVVNSGTMDLQSNNNIVAMKSLEMDGGTLQLYSAGLSLISELTTSGDLRQNYTGYLGSNDIGVMADDYTITASNVTVKNITQEYGIMNISSSDVTVNGNINATDLTIAANPDTDWLDLSVGGSILGNTKIHNLEQMTVGGNYVFDSNSQLLAAILPYDVTPGINSTTRNYWSTVSLNNDNTLGQITNAEDGAALIQVGGKFTSGTQFNSSLALNSTLGDGQIGLRFTDVSNITQETAIWLLQAEEGVIEFSDLEKIRNLSVLFCNAGNTVCVALNEENLGAYISVRDTDASGSADSLYVVFDPRFGGPVLIENNRIQPIVARQPDYTAGEYVAAGALDNLISGQLLNKGFFNQSPIEAIPAIFDGTNVETLMTELYNRMEHYVETADGSIFVPFSRLVQPYEIEQVAGVIALNEHTSARNFEDRMIDEFIWNRNRNLKKAWADFDFGMFSQNLAEDGRVYGNRFELAGGFDWQESDTLILGLTGRVSHTSSDNSDDIDLSYLPNQTVLGNVSVDVADTNIGLGAYLMKTLGQKFRAYGNAFIDLHLIDTMRNQTFVGTIDGSGTALALTTEWGIMHDWLNQYIVGNLYARTGYNFGFSIAEKAAGENYMDLESDGYFMLTPGYSLTAQKRIYPSVWFQIRPYATIGVEYDVFGAPDYARYKFAAANIFSEYGIEIDPLWANIGGGFEFLSVSGVQFGIDYRYQYNNDMQLHNIKVSGSYRF